MGRSITTLFQTTSGKYYAAFAKRRTTSISGDPHNLSHCGNTSTQVCKTCAITSRSSKAKYTTSHCPRFRSTRPVQRSRAIAVIP